VLLNSFLWLNVPQENDCHFGGRRFVLNRMPQSAWHLHFYVFEDLQGPITILDKWDNFCRKFPRDPILVSFASALKCEARDGQPLVFIWLLILRRGRGAVVPKGNGGRKPGRSLFLHSNGLYNVQAYTLVHQLMWVKRLCWPTEKIAAQNESPKKKPYLCLLFLYL